MFLDSYQKQIIENAKVLIQKIIGVNEPIQIHINYLDTTGSEYPLYTGYEVYPSCFNPIAYSSSWRERFGSSEGFADLNNAIETFCRKVSNEYSRLENL